MESNVQLAIKTLKSLFGTDMMKLLQKQTFSGAKVLATKLKS
jgi:hypothetical protein